MQELICNLHIHSNYSDGTGSYSQILDAAVQAGVDIVIVTDHNILVHGVEGYYKKSDKQVLLLTGEEVHDQGREPQKNHMLVLGAKSEVAGRASNPQELIQAVNELGGLTFLAHPDEYALELFHEADISWVDWDVEGYTGFELWNAFSEFKTVARSLGEVVQYGFFPEQMAQHPLEKTISRWDKLLTQKKHIVVVGGSDAHALNFRFGPFKKTIFPYAFHFSAINNHLLLPEKLSGKIESDKVNIYSALQKGSSFIGYDLPASTRGFSFTIENEEKIANLGDSIILHQGATAQVKLPQAVELRLICNGEMIYQSDKTDRLALPLIKPGAYRVECYIDFIGKKRGWIFSNPICLSKE